MVAAAILAGGQGRRMGGIFKPFLMVDGQRIIDRQLAVLRPLFQPLVIVAANSQAFLDQGIADIDVIPDRVGPGLGPLAGLDAALAWLPSRCQSLVCVAGDMPYLAPAILRQLRDEPPADAAAVVPRLGSEDDRRPQPLCARYHRTVASLVATELAKGTRAVRTFLDSIVPETLPPGLIWIDESALRARDPTLATFTNINSPTDLRRS